MTHDDDEDDEITALLRARDYWPPLEEPFGEERVRSVLAIIASVFPGPLTDNDKRTN